jgi:hypothetical protein
MRKLQKNKTVKLKGHRTEKIKEKKPQEKFRAIWECQSDKTSNTEKYLFAPKTERIQ